MSKFPHGVQLAYRRLGRRKARAVNHPNLTIRKRSAKRPRSRCERNRSGWSNRYIGYGRKSFAILPLLLRLTSRSVLSAFEESSAACISDMLRQVSNGQYLEAIRMAEKFILHVEVLFATIDDLEYHFSRLKLKGLCVYLLGLVSCTLI